MSFEITDKIGRDGLSQEKHIFQKFIDDGFLPADFNLSGWNVKFMSKTEDNYFFQMSTPPGFNLNTSVRRSRMVARLVHISGIVDRVNDYSVWYTTGGNWSLQQPATDNFRAAGWGTFFSFGDTRNRGGKFELGELWGMPFPRFRHEWYFFQEK